MKRNFLLSSSIFFLHFNLFANTVTIKTNFNNGDQDQLVKLLSKTALEGSNVFQNITDFEGDIVYQTREVYGYMVVSQVSNTSSIDINGKLVELDMKNTELLKLAINLDLQHDEIAPGLSHYSGNIKFKCYIHTEIIPWACEFSKVQ